MNGAATEVVATKVAATKVTVIGGGSSYTPELVNFANPSGLVTEALNRHAPDVPAGGVCNSPITTKQYYYHTDRKLAAQQQWPPSRAEKVAGRVQAVLDDMLETHRAHLPHLWRKA